MKKEIHILYLEDAPADVVLVNHELRKGGSAFRMRRVDSKESFLHELEHHTPDVILSDHGLPTFDGFTALAIVKDQWPDVPFIFVTGSLGEEMAIKAFESGATDYVLKSRLSDLVPVILRALREAGERAQRRQQEQALRDSEERLRMLLEGVKDYAVVMLDREGRVASWNAGARWLYGYRPEEVMGRHCSFFYVPEDVGQGRPALDLRTVAAEGRFTEDGLRLAKGARRFQARVVTTTLRDDTGKLRGFAQVTQDLTGARPSDATMNQTEAPSRRRANT